MSSEASVFKCEQDIFLNMMSYSQRENVSNDIFEVRSANQHHKVSCTQPQKAMVVTAQAAYITMPMKQTLSSLAVGVLFRNARQATP